MEPCSKRAFGASVGPCHPGAAGFGYGGVRAMHETAMVRLPHLHPTQEDHGEGNASMVRTTVAFVHENYDEMSSSTNLYHVTNTR